MPISAKRRCLFSAGLVLLFALQGMACRGQGAVSPQARRPAPATLPDTTFARLIDQLSEPGRYFDTDNLISNERSYLHVAPALQGRGAGGGAYLGVGPDQNFSYIAHLRPEIAFIVDVRRDNVLLHLFYKALFARAHTRLEYLSLLFGRPPPADGAESDGQALEALLAYIDRAPAGPEAVQAAQAAVLAEVRAMGLTLREGDLDKIGAIHARFIESGLELRFTSHGRSPRPYYPSYRQLLMETDRDGQPMSYLAREADFRFVRGLQAANRVIPVTGDLAGAHALQAIGRYLSTQGATVRAFYTSNVEDYLMRDGQFEGFVRNLEALPHDGEGVIVRSYFHYWRGPHPQTAPGYASTQLLQPIAGLVSAYRQGAVQHYGDLLDAYLPD